MCSSSTYDIIPQGFGAKCTQVLGSGTNQKDIEEILRVHNELRAEIANGLEKRGRPGPQPPATDMEQMVRMNAILSPICGFFSHIKKPSNRFFAFVFYSVVHIFPDRENVKL